MFQTAELARLEKRKTELVRQSEENRQKLMEHWERLSSSDYWVDEAHGLIRRHPAVTTGLAAAGGLLAVKLLRKPGNIFGALGGVGKMTSIAMTAWRLLRRRKE